jgi:signal transduction histidine kinase
MAEQTPRFVERLLGALGRAVAGADYPSVRAPGPQKQKRLGRFALPTGVLLLIALAVIAAQYLGDTREIHTVGSWLLGAFTVAPAALMLRRPLLAWRLLTVGLFLGPYHAVEAEAFPWNPVQLFVAIAVLLVVALRADRLVLLWVGLITLIPVLVFDDEGSSPGVVLLVIALLTIGSAFRRVRQVEGALAEQAEVTEREQARRGLLEERARIARELHDVVAHHMSLLAVRAETAPYRLAEVSEPARAEFTALAQAARDALTDLRRLLGVLRSDVAEPELAPQPDLDAVTGLVESARRAGVDVHYLPPQDGIGQRPPDPVALAGFRIIQEALANATRHAPGALVTVQLWPGAAELAVRVHNAPPPAGAAPAVPGPGAGHGVTGMRERATALGGEFAAEPTADGGFSVTATLPYDAGTGNAGTGNAGTGNAGNGNAGTGDAGTGKDGEVV